MNGNRFSDDYLNNCEHSYHPNYSIFNLDLWNKSKPSCFVSEEKSGRAGLRRLLESEHFSPLLALHYFYRYPQDPGLQHYLCQRLQRCFSNDELAAYLPQWISLVESGEAGPVEEMLVAMAMRDRHLACQIIWLLSEGSSLRKRIRRDVTHLKNNLDHSSLDIDATLVGFGCILGSIAAPDAVCNLRRLLLGESTKRAGSPVLLLESEDAILEVRSDAIRRQRTNSQSSVLESHIALPEINFVERLTQISKMLLEVSILEQNSRLLAELDSLNKEMLPGQFCLPAWCHQVQHSHILRISEAVLLNSAERKPFALFLEVGRLDALSSNPNCATPPPIVQQRRPSFIKRQQEISEKMHAAAVALAQLARHTSQSGDLNSAAIQQKIIAEMEELERTRLRDPIAFIESAVEIEVGVSSEDPSASVLQEEWSRKYHRLKQASPFQKSSDWNLVPVIVKAGTEMRQELFATQLISLFAEIFREEGLELWLRPYKVLVTGSDCGLVEVIPDALSMHSLRRASQCSLRHYFIRRWGSPDGASFLQARHAFLQSLVAYSLVSYVLALKDRHNGNILLDRYGHLIHIDFGFMLGGVPGGVAAFEASPFKLTSDYIELLGGNLDSRSMLEFRRLLEAGLKALWRHADKIKTLLRSSYHQNIACFARGVDPLIEDVVGRIKDADAESLVRQSANNVFTRLYDAYQYYTNGICY